MKIKLKVSEEYGGGTRSCKEPYKGASHAIVNGDHDCPACFGKRVLVAHDTKETAIFLASDHKRAVEFLVERGADADMLEEVPHTEIWAVAGKCPNETEYTCEAVAYCTRCKTEVGEAPRPLRHGLRHQRGPPRPERPLRNRDRRVAWKIPSTWAMACMRRSNTGRSS